MTSRLAHHDSLRPAVPSDLGALTAIGRATGQDEDWDEVFPGYVMHLIEYGSMLVAERDGAVTGYGGTLRIGEGPAAVSMLTDLFVYPAVHGTGTGRTLLSALWGEEPRRMTFSSLHARALPLYTSFGLDAWWPLLYLRGDVRRLRCPDGWSVAAAAPAQVGALERAWTGLDRTAQHEFWARWPHGSCLVASLHGQPVAAGAVGGAHSEYGISHLAVDAGVADAGTGGAGIDGAGVDGARAADARTPGAGRARDAVLAVLSRLEPADGQARVCLPAPHPAVRPLLGAGWRIEEFDLYMASHAGLIDPCRPALSPAMA